MRFKGQVSKIWALAIIGLNIVTIAVMIYYGFSGVTYVLIPVLILMDLMIGPPLFINDVVVEKKYFVIHYGFTTAKFLIDDITSVKKTDALFGTYAIGSDKIELTKKASEQVVVSLIDNKGFINEIKKQNRKIKIYV